MFNIYPGIHNAYAIHDAVYVACRKADEGACGLRSNREIAKDNVFYFVGGLFVIVRIVRKFADYAEETDDFRVVFKFVRAFGRFVKVFKLIFYRKVGNGFAVSVEVA